MDVASLEVVISANVDDLNRAVDGLEEKLQAAGVAAEKSGDKMSAGLTAPVRAIAAAAGQLKPMEAGLVALGGAADRATSELKELSTQGVNIAVNPAAVAGLTQIGTAADKAVEDIRELNAQGIKIPVDASPGLASLLTTLNKTEAQVRALDGTELGIPINPATSAALDAIAQAADRAGDELKELSSAGGSVNVGGASGVSDLGQAADKTRDSFGRFKKAGEDAAGAAAKLGGASEEAGAKIGRLQAINNSVAGSIANFDKERAKLQNGFGELGGRLQDVGGNLTQYVSLPLAAVGGYAIKTAADFERMGDILQAQSGASASEMAKVSEVARQLGADITLPGTSASDALKAILELSKGGLSLADSMNAARGTIQLSTAAQIDNARAAEIQANALNAFGLSAANAGRVADLLAGGANKSSASIQQMADGFQAGAAVARMAGLTIDEFTTSLAAMANAGIKGSDAGTSIKSMLMALQAPTDKAAEKMKALGISIFDAQGAVLPFPQIISQFSGALAGLNDQAKADVLSTIFGSDGVRAASIIFREGPAGFAKLQAAVSKSGQAAEAAAAQNKGFYGSLDALRSATDTFLTGAATPLLDGFAGIARGAADLVGAMDSAPGPIKATGVAMAGLAIATGPVLFGIGGIVKAIPTMITGLTALRGAVLSVNTALAAGAVGLAALAAVQLNEYMNAPTDADRNIKEQERYTEEFKALSKERQQAAAQELVSAINDSNRQIEQSKRAIEAFKEANAEIRKRNGIDNEGGPSLRFRTTDPKDLKLLEENNKKIAEYEAKLGTASERLNVFRARLDGAKAASKDLGAATTALGTTADEVTPKLAGLVDTKIADAIAEIENQLRTADKSFAVFGDAFDIVGEKTSILENGINRLLELGLKPADKVIQDFFSRAGNINLDAFKNLTVDVKPLETKDLIPEGNYRIEVDVHGNLQKVDAKGMELINLKPFTTQDLGFNALLEMNDAFKLAGESAAVFGDSYTQTKERAAILEGTIRSLIENGFTAQSDVVQLLKGQLDTLNEGLNTTIELGPLLAEATKVTTDAFLDFGIGLATSADSAENLALKMFESIGDMLIQLGKSALMAGIGVEAIQKALGTLQGAGAIAAGIALVALGAAVKAGVASASKGASGGGGGGSSRAPSSGSITSNRPQPVQSNLSNEVRANQGGGYSQEVKVTGEISVNNRTLLVAVRNAEKDESRTSANG